MTTSIVLNSTSRAPTQSNAPTAQDGSHEAAPADRVAREPQGSSWLPDTTGLQRLMAGLWDVSSKGGRRLINSMHQRPSEAKTFEAQGNYLRALTAARKQVREQPGSVQAKLELGHVATAIGCLLEAIQCLSAVADSGQVTTQQRVLAKEGLAIAYLCQGNSALALDAAQQAIEIARDTPKIPGRPPVDAERAVGVAALVGLANACDSATADASSQARYNLLSSKLQKIVDEALSTRQADPFLTTLAAELIARGGELDNAKEILRNVLSQCPLFPLARMTQACVSYFEGESDQARHAIRGLVAESMQGNPQARVLAALLESNHNLAHSYLSQAASHGYVGAYEARIWLTMQRRLSGGPSFWQDEVFHPAVEKREYLNAVANIERLPIGEGNGTRTTSLIRVAIAGRAWAEASRYLEDAKNAGCILWSARFETAMVRFEAAIHGGREKRRHRAMPGNFGHTKTRRHRQCKPAGSARKSLDEDRYVQERAG